MLDPIRSRGASLLECGDRDDQLVGGHAVDGDRRAAAVREADGGREVADLGKHRVVEHHLDRAQADPPAGERPGQPRRRHQHEALADQAGGRQPGKLLGIGPVPVGGRVGESGDTETSGPRGVLRQARRERVRGFTGAGQGQLIAQPAVHPQQPAGRSAAIVPLQPRPIAGSGADQPQGGRVQHPHGAAAVLYPHRNSAGQLIQAVPVQIPGSMFVPAGDPQPLPGLGVCCRRRQDTIEVGRASRRGHIDGLPRAHDRTQVHMLIVQPGDHGAAGRVQHHLAGTERQPRADLQDGVRPDPDVDRSLPSDDPVADQDPGFFPSDHGGRTCSASAP
jgi:hypothetical protein